MSWLQWIAENWFVIVIVALFLLGIVIAITNTQQAKRWLYYAVTMAEKELGSGTGQIKLRQVYDMFIQRYPIFSKFVPFETFSRWVDEALVFLRNQLENNTKVKELIEN